MADIYAFIWKASEPDETFIQDEFTNRVPRLMEWLKKLKADNRLIACGGGGFENHSGGLTLVLADSPEHASELSNGSPMNEIGHTDIMFWDVYYGNLVQLSNESKLDM